MNRTYISGGMIYDGTGGDPFFGDIVINGSKIEEVLPHRTDRFIGTEGPLIHAGGQMCIRDRQSYRVWAVNGKLHMARKRNAGIFGSDILII